MQIFVDLLLPFHPAPFYRQYDPQLFDTVHQFLISTFVVTPN